MRNPRAFMLGSMIVMLLLVGCGTPELAPTSSPVPPSPVPTEARTLPATQGEEWDYVAIGGPDTWGIFKDYAAHLEADLGVKITVHDWHASGLTTVSLLTRLSKNQGLREALSEAEVVTFTARPAERIGWRCITTEDKPDFDCSPEALAAFEEDYRAIIAEIESLRRGSETIIRTMDLYTPYHGTWRELGIYDECWRCWEAVNESISKVAAERGIPVAPVCDAFNGPDHGEDPGEKGYVQTVGHGDANIGDATETGRAVIADLLRDLGYEPMVP
jgi:hypothetical protein